MKGHIKRTPERVAEARLMRANGADYHRIAEHFGIAYTTAHAWVTDPDRNQELARKESYRGTCEECGAPTYGGRGPGKAATHCVDCVRWTREQVLDVFSTFVILHGRSPRVIDATVGHPGHGLLPHVEVAKRLFGGWNEALLAADLPLAMDRRPETQARIEELASEGLTYREIAERLDMTEGKVRQRLYYRGIRAASGVPNRPARAPSK